MSELYHGETYDARLELEGFSSGDFNSNDWHGVETIDHGFDMLKPQINEPVRAIQKVQPVECLITPKGETVIDFGQNLVGWVRFSVSGAKGAIVTLQHAEILDAEGNLYTENLTAKQTIQYTLKGGGQETYEPRFTFQGFRYVRLDGFTVEQLNRGVFEAVVLHSDFEETELFNAQIPWLINCRAIFDGAQGNFLMCPRIVPSVTSGLAGREMHRCLLGRRPI